MTPTSWVSLVSFLFFLLPGLFLDQLSKRHKRTEKESALAELGRIVLGSIGFTSFALTCLLIAQKTKPHWFLNPEKFISEPGNYFSGHFSLVVRTFLYEGILVFLGVLLFENYRVAKNNPNFTTAHNWDVLFRNRRVETFKATKFMYKIVNRIHPDLRKDDFIIVGGKKTEMVTIPVALVTLKSEQQIVGYVDMYSVEDSPSEREIVMSPVEGMYKPYLPGSFLKIANQSPDWVKLYLSSTSIESIAVVYFKFPMEER